MFRIPNNLRNAAILLLVGYVFLMLGNSFLSLTNPNEVFYAQTAREMQQKNTWMTPYLFGEPQFEKPIMTYWLVRLAFEIFGVNPFSARYFCALFGVIGAIAVYYLGLLGFKDERKAFVSAVVLMSGGLYVGLSRTLFTDMIFSVYILLSLLSFYWGYALAKRRQAGWVLFFVFSALAVLTKGPLGLILPFLAVFVFLLIRREAGVLKGWGFPLGVAAFCAAALPWYILMIRTYGDAFINEFFVNDHWRRVVEAEHPAADTWFYYPLSTLGSVFPWSFFLAAAVISRLKDFKRRLGPFGMFLVIWVLTVFLTFQVAHSKLTSYILPYFPALALVVGNFLVEAERMKRTGVLKGLYLATGIFSFAFPAGLVVATLKFPEYVTNVLPVFVFVGVLVVYLAVFIVVTWRRRFAASFWLLSALLPLLLAFALPMSSHFESYVSSRDAGRYVNEHARPDETILSSKFFARGIRYYTDRTVAVLDISGSGYFSPHPVDYLNTVEKFRDFLAGRLETYAVLRKKDYDSGLERLTGDAYTHEVLYVAGDEYVVRFVPKATDSR